MAEKTPLADFGVIGLAVMGANLARNVADHGFRVAVWNRDRTKVDRLLAEGDGEFAAPAELADFVRTIERPRPILLMVKAGGAVDKVIESLLPHLDEGDILIDGGNSWFRDTDRRERELAAKGIRFVGMGVSGGEKGARYGPSIMPGGEAAAYERLRPVLEAIAARTDAGPCVTHVGPGGAGHFVKMVHNGIEYGDMQIIAEGYDLLRRGLEMDAGEAAAVFAGWNEGELESFLTDLTAKVLAVPDPKGGGALVDAILDRAEQKGTGRWTISIALELGVPVPTLAAAVDARIISSMREDRIRASASLGGPAIRPFDGERRGMIDAIRDALYASKIISYAQGMSLIGAASEEHRWGVDRAETARIWKGGCIIRARLLDPIREAFGRDRDLPNLLLDPVLGGAAAERQIGWRHAVAFASSSGIPVPAIAASLAYFDSYRTSRLPQNLTQAQRDAFGSHTYRRLDDPEGKAIHTGWL